MATATTASPAAGAATTAPDTAAAAAPITTAPSSSSTDSVQEQIRQLNDARKLVLANVSYYPSIVQGILPIINPTSLPQLRRWGADFLAEAFAAPALPSREKETLSLLVLESLKSMLENDSEDAFVLQSIIQAASSIYPLVMRWLINNSYDTPTWERMTAIKSRILRLWESPSPSVQICCIKFAQRVVLAQTQAIGEQKRDGLDISLSLVPQNHPLLDPRHLEAEASGLLDRMLGVLQDNKNDALIVDATLNTLSILVRTRPSTTNRTVNALLNFNPLKTVTGDITPRTRVMLKSMEKTARMLLIHLSKRDPNNAFVPRMQQQIERLMRSRAELFDDMGRKRMLADQQAAAQGDAKRQKMASGGAAAIPQLPQSIPPLGPGPHTLADIFTITSNAQLRAFNASHVPLDLATKISASTLARLDPQLLQLAVQGIRDRLSTLEAAAAAAIDPNTAPLGVDVDDDDDDYEPDFSAAEDAEQIMNKLDNESGGGGGGSGGFDSTADKEAMAKIDAASLALGAFKLPVAPPLSPEQAVKVGEATVTRVFDTMKTSEDVSSSAVAVRKTGNSGGLARVAASSYDKESWITILTRLATRSVSGLEDDDHEEDDDEAEEGEERGEGEERKAKKEKRLAKGENDTHGKEVAAKAKPALNNKIRESLFNYILEDFRKRIDVAVAWLCEEWYNDRLEAMYRHDDEDESQASTGSKGHYDEWVVKLLDAFLPYLHSQDNKVLTRFLSEVPALNGALLQRVKSLCRDPALVPVALTSLLYQLMMRPPARSLTLDTMQEIWVEFEDARPMATKYLDKWRPGFVKQHTEAEAAANGAVTGEASAEGAAAVAAA